MSTSNSPIFKLNFEQTGDTLTDITSNGYEATINSTTACTPVAHDPLMGRCLQFDGTSDGYCTIAQNLNGTGVADLSNGITMCAWVNFTKYTFSSNLLQLGAATDTVAFVIGSGTPVYVNAAKPQGNMLPKVATIGQWHHMAITVDSDGELIFYMDGVALKPANNPVDKLAEAFKTTSIQIGGKDFEAMLAWLSLYNGPLSPAEILADMGEGQANRVSDFRRSYPFDFKLTTDDGGAENPIMYIEDEGSGEDLHFAIQNTSNQTITIDKGTSPAGLKNYQFQLRFRPGTLSGNFLSPKNLTSLRNKNWSVMTEPSEDNSGTDCISFIYTGNTALTLSSGEEHVIVIEKVNASAVGGTRNTNVEMRYKLGNSTGIQGNRTQNLSLVNHIGEKNISLRAEVVGNASVMTYAKNTDGTGNETAPTSELMFRIVNNGTKSLPLATAGAKNGATTFTLSIDVQPEGHLVEWALIDQGDINGLLQPELNKLGVVRKYDSDTNNITLEGPLIESLKPNTALLIGTGKIQVNTSGAVAGTYEIALTAAASGIQEGDDIELQDQSSNWQTAQITPPPKSKGLLNAPKPGATTGDVLINKMQWTFTNQSIEALDPNGGLSFLLKGIECSLPSGATVVTIEYANIPGHWNGQFELPIERSPMALNENLVGINTQQPEASLHIQQEQSFSPLKISKEASGNLPIKYDVQAPKGTLNGPYIAAFSVNDNAVMCYENTLWTDFTFRTSMISKDNYSIKSYSLPNPENRGEGPVLYHQGSIFAITNDEEGYYLNVYAFNGNSTPESGNYYALQDEHGTKYTGLAIGIIGDFLFLACLQFNNTPGAILRYSGVSTGTSTNAPTLVLDKVIPTAPDTPIAMKAYGNRLYIAASSHYLSNNLTQLWVWTIDGKGDHSAATIKFDGDEWNLYQQINAVNNDYVVLNGLSDLGPFAFGIINVSDPSNPTIVQTPSTVLEGALSQRVAVYQNMLIASGNKHIYLYDYTNKGAYNLLKRIPTSSYCDVNLIEDKLVFSYGKLNSYKTAREIKVYDAKSFIDYYLGQNTLISSENITIGSTSQSGKSSLKVPYPKEAGENGICIGNESSSESAALTIGVSSDSAPDPVSVTSEEGSPIFNIKQPESGKSEYRVGIGTNDPKSALHIAASVNWQNYSEGSTSNTPFNYINGNKKTVDVQRFVSSGPKSSWPTSMIAEHAIICNQIFILSDARIKELVPAIDPVNDLSTLLGLKVSDYQYIDFVGKGSGQKKGLIAQQVKEGFPQAVSAENTDFIPDIYAMASDLGWQPVTKQLRVSLEKVHDLKVGDKVRLIADKSFEEKEVVAIPNNKSFVVADWNKPVEKLFVFGKEVHDFHTVDYDQVAMLGVSAIQALHQKVEGQGQKIESLEMRLLALEQENKQLKTERADELAEIRQELRDFKTAISKQYQN